MKILQLVGADHGLRSLAGHIFCVTGHELGTDDGFEPHP